jgi:hypothetical protein
MVGSNHFDRLAQDRTGVLRRHAHGYDRLRAAVNRVDRVLIVQYADLHRFFIGVGGRERNRYKHRGGKSDERLHLFLPVGRCR